ncbi:MAG: DUF2628 domain-containing protein [Methylocella sp.]
MTVYSVHLPGEGVSGVAEAAFVKEGFTRGAFWLGPLWLLTHGLWTGFAIWLAAFLILLLLLAGGVLSAGSVLILIVLMQILLGLEANRLLEAKLWKDGYNLTEIVAGPALDQAEIAFYRHFESPEAAALNRAPQVGAVPPTAGRAIVGSFPEPGARR